MLFRKRFAPMLVDLVAYEKDLLYQREHGIVLRPCPPLIIPDLLFGAWSESEMQTMRDNHEQAQLIYKRIKGSQ